ncbi:GDP-mannose 4,6-dehydratase [Geosporobacter ferrireducens]|uniref:GDP-mannose 4,6-dehydratase n=1 Tax=Geosporobacter ferrireducens TaxID=1424294 RepID=UPI00139D4C49|nr:GDP-mannose 4,6-dehydratase [Geosporobacter ferrireducens]MTI53316.1 GDP-mannose 4,6-dehydratase [Geosporobacter ferrireducens]
MKALITGVNGFVGKYLSDYLIKKSIEVWGTTYGVENIFNETNDIITRELDIADIQEVKKVLVECKPDYIFHLAAQSSAAISWKNPQLTMQVNINGTLNLLQSVRELGINPRILLIGSSEEYGFVRPEDIPVNEMQALKPSNPYAISKIAQSMMGELYVKAYDMDIIMVRAFNHIGPGQSSIFVASDFAKKIAEIEKGIVQPILMVGNLEARRDFTDVRDIVRAYYELAKKGEQGDLYNVGSGVSYPIQYILDTLLSITNSKIQVCEDFNKMRPSDAPIIECDNTKLKNLTGWYPRYVIEDTLRDILDFWRDNI